MLAALDCVFVELLITLDASLLTPTHCKVVKLRPKRCTLGSFLFLQLTTKEGTANGENRVGNRRLSYTYLVYQNVHHSFHSKSTP